MLFVWVLLFLLVAFLVLFLMITNSFKNPVRAHDKTPDDIGIPFEEISIPTYNSRALYGWWIPGNKTAPTVILVHGWGRNASRMMPYIKVLHEKGYNLLAFDSRNHGSSDKDDFSTMLKFSEDIRSTIEFGIQQSFIKDYVGLIGLSIGGAASIHASAFDEHIKAVVTVGAFANPKEVMIKQLKDHHIPQPVIWFTLRYLEHKVGFKFQDIAPQLHIGKSYADILLIHGEEDVTVPPEQAEKLLKSGKAGHVTLWKIPGRGHSDCHFEKGFWDKVNSFLELNLSAKE
jgi:pimeloyl-ACP methyl ester carboxylesterase